MIHEDLPAHHCPGCGTLPAAFPRYPWRFCNDCVRRATDGAGRRLEFSNAGLSGGFQYRLQGSRDWVECGHALALIAGRPVLVGEARFGGIVAQPLAAEPLFSNPPGALPTGTKDLRNEDRT